MDIDEKVDEIREVLSKTKQIMTGFSTLDLKSDGMYTTAYVDGVLIGTGYDEIIYIHSVGDISPSIILNKRED